MQRIWYYILFFTAYFLNVSNASAIEEKYIVLAKGESTFITTTVGGKISTTGDKNIDLQDLGNKLIVRAKKVGSSVVVSNNATTRVEVVESADKKLYLSLQNFVIGKKGLQVVVKNAHIELIGKLLTTDDFDDVVELVKKHSGHFQFNVESSSEVQNYVDLNLRKELQNQLLLIPQLQLNHKFTAYIAVEQKDHLDKYQQVLRPWGVVVEVSKDAVDVAPMVEVSILVAEVKRKAFQKLGVQWPASVDAQLIRSATLPNLSVQALEEKGLGKVLASPKLLCRNNKEADFLAGGEFPIKIANFKIHDVIWKKYGILLNVKPKVDLSGRMSIAITAEVSMIDDSQVVDGIPGLLTNRLQTHFDITKERTIALSGLLKQEWGKSRSGLPFLSNIPIIGRLFSSEDYRNNQSELMVFVTPRLVSPAEEKNDNVEMPKGAQDDLS